MIPFAATATRRLAGLCLAALLVWAPCAALGAEAAEEALARADHPSGVTLLVHGLRRVGDQVVVSISATHNGERPVYLNAVGRAWLEDDRGNRLPLVQPASAPRMELMPLHRLRASLSFRGLPAPGARAVWLVLNQGSPGGGAAATTEPAFRLRLPWPPPAEG
jgi:hypothetical protein